MTGPITPKEAQEKKQKSIPEGVFEVFNELIVENLQNGHATIRQDEVVKRLRAKMNVTTIEMSWLDVEPSYRAAGWEVEYDKPGYNETYEPTYSFSKKR